MTYSRLGAHYSKWDGTQQIEAADADELIRALSDDLLQNGDLDLALQRLFRWGFERSDGEHVPGLREMLQRLKERRQEQLDRYDLGSIVDQIKEQLEEIIAKERAALNERLSSTPGDEGQTEDTEQSRSAGDTQPGDQTPSGDQTGQSGEANQAGGQREGGPSAGGEEAESASDEASMQAIADRIARRKLERLDGLPGDPAGMIRDLNDYEFMSPEARQQFQDLLASLQQQMMQSAFQGMQAALGGMTPENVGEMRQMMHELNELLEARQRGEEGGFEEFMHRWGHFFGEGIENLDDLMEHMSRQMAAMQNLMESLSPEQRSQLENMMSAIMQDEGLQEEMSRLSENLGRSMGSQDWRRRYQFSGDEAMTLNEALRMMDKLKDYDQLEHELREVQDWNDLADLDENRLRELLGDEEAEQMQQLQRMTEVLQEAGYIRKTRRGFELTPQGVRKIGEKALSDIFRDLNKEKLGQHDLRDTGGAGERTDYSKPYEFGDPFLLDLPKTVMNAIQRDGAGAPVRLHPNDFEVYRTEYSTRSATVLMVDMSRSMLYNGCFNAAKRVALALDSLIRSKYPRDELHIIGFSYLAQTLKSTELPTLDWNEYNYGTNMQHGFQLARQLLAKSKGSNKQIIVVTDGEPTAHFEPATGNVRFSYPPTPATFQETLKEVMRCTRERITINTFMLERSPFMVQFINDLMRINTGRVFIATPDRLGEYILVDYVSNKRRWIG